MTFTCNLMIRLTLVLSVLGAGGPAAWASDLSAGASPSETTVTPTVDEARTLLVSQLIERGAPETDARQVVNALTDEDVRVLSENPNMLTPAGNSTVIAWVVLLAVIITGAALIIIAN